MGTKVRVNNEWISLENNTAIVPSGFNGDWNETTKTHNAFHTNNTGQLIYVSATFRVATQAGESTVVTAGSSAWAYVSDPDSTSIDTDVQYTELGRVRDNGTADANNLYLNSRFFVPNTCKYIVKLYKTDATTDWGSNSRVTTLNWNEFVWELTSN